MGNGQITFQNRADEPHKVKFDWKVEKIEYPDFDHEVDFSQTIYNIEYIWRVKNLKNTDKVLKTEVAPVMYLHKVDQKIKTLS